MSSFLEQFSFSVIWPKHAGRSCLPILSLTGPDPDEQMETLHLCSRSSNEAYLYLSEFTHWIHLFCQCIIHALQVILSLFQKADQYTLTVGCSDLNGKPGGNFVTNNVVINILDVNDNPPVLEKDQVVFFGFSFDK